MNTESLHTLLELSIFFLTIAVAVAIAVRHLRLPYTVGLVLVGSGLTFLRPSNVHVSPEIIMGILVPPLLFEAAFHLSLDDLRKNIVPILTWAIPGVVVTTLLVGWGVERTVGISLSAAIVFGALIAATDPVAVIALFKSLGVPKRLRILLEGESLLNDGTAIIVFKIALAAALTGEFSLSAGIVEFFRTAGGGILVGLIVSLLATFVLARINDHLVETTITFIVAYGASLAGESLHVSGVLAVVTAGLIVGNLGHEQMSPTTYISVTNFWEFMAFLANSFVFLLIGLEVNVSVLIAHWQPILWAIGAVLVARAVVIYGSSLFVRTVPRNWQHVMVWGGLRGAISLALALSLPLTLGSEREILQAMAFGVVLFTILVQGISMSPLLRKLNVVKNNEDLIEFELRRGQAVAARAGFDRARQMYHQGLISRKAWEVISKVLEESASELSTQSANWLELHPELASEELDNTWREILRVQRNTTLNLLNNDVISEESYARLTSQIDTALAKEQITWRQKTDVASELKIATETHLGDK
jgi:CPA1 family monovalent cation:H+ antiporter